MRDNGIGKKLKEGKPVLGIGLSLGSQRSAEIVSQTEFDFAMVDMLHGHYDKPSATDALRSIARAGGPAPFARVSRNDAGSINDMLDAGAIGIVVPMVNSASEARSAVEGAYYPPLGKRSKGSAAAIFYDSEYSKSINHALTLVVMIETPEAVERADEILAVPGIGCCLIGTGDLSFVMEQPKNSPELLQAVDHVIRAGAARGVPIGVAVNTAREATFWRDRGAVLFLTSHDLSLLAGCVRSYDAEFLEFRREAGS
jgi:2-keto-3-deoxy-L-rhamnonate aldolase RhmA